MSAKMVSIQSFKTALFFNSFKQTEGFPLFSQVARKINTEYLNSQQNQYKNEPSIAVFILLTGLSWFVMYILSGSKELFSFRNGILGITGGIFLSAITMALFNDQAGKNHSEQDDEFSFQTFYIHLNENEYRFYQFCQNCIRFVPYIKIRSFAQLLDNPQYLTLWQDIFNAGYDQKQLEFVFQLAFCEKLGIHKDFQELLTEMGFTDKISAAKFGFSCLQPHIRTESEETLQIPTECFEIPDFQILIRQVLTNRMENPDFPVYETIYQSLKKLQA